MTKKSETSLILVLVLLLNLTLNGHLCAEESEPASAGASIADPAQETLMDIGLVAGIGGAGAVLGLSTLPFYEKPGDHMKNIIMGGALGIILGVGLVAFSQATKSKDMYYESAKVLLNPSRMSLFEVSSIEYNLPAQKVLPHNVFELNADHFWPTLKINTSF